MQPRCRSDRFYFPSQSTDVHNVVGRKNSRERGKGARSAIFIFPFQYILTARPELG